MSDFDGNDEPPPKSWFDRVVRVFRSSAPSDLSEVKTILRDAADQGVVDIQVLPLLEGALLVADMQAREIMIPLSQTISIPMSSSTDDILRMVIDSGHSRFPVIGDSTDDIKGILHAKDFLPLALASEDRNFELKDCIRTASMIPESKRLDDLLQAFRDTHNHMAIVIDEYGDPVGVVTIEDVLEQIVGDIADEHDVDGEDFIRQIEPGSFIVKAVTPISDFNDAFKMNFATTEHETIGGIVLSKFGRMPKRDDAVRLEDLEIVVLNADSRRINLLQVSLSTNPAPEQPENTDV